MRKILIQHSDKILQTAQAEFITYNNKNKYTFLDIITKYCPTIKKLIFNDGFDNMAYPLKKYYDNQSGMQSSILSEYYACKVFANSLNLNLHKPHYALEHGEQCRHIYYSDNSSLKLYQYGGCNYCDMALYDGDTLIAQYEIKQSVARATDVDIGFPDSTTGILNMSESFKNAVIPEYIEFIKNWNYWDNHALRKNYKLTDEVLNRKVVEQYLHKNEKSDNVEIKLLMFYQDPTKTKSNKNSCYLIELSKQEFLDNITTEDSEIRDCGKNHAQCVNKDKCFAWLSSHGVNVNNSIFTINKNLLEERRARNSNQELTGYKIDGIYFVYLNDLIETTETYISFNKNKIRQCKPNFSIHVRLKEV